MSDQTPSHQDEYGTIKPYNSSGLDMSSTPLNAQFTNMGNGYASDSNRTANTSYQPSSRLHPENEYGFAEPYNSSGLDTSYMTLNEQLANVGDGYSRVASMSVEPLSQQNFEHGFKTGRSYGSSGLNRPYMSINEQFANMENEIIEPVPEPELEWDKYIDWDPQPASSDAPPSTPSPRSQQNTVQNTENDNNSEISLLFPYNGNNNNPFSLNNVGFPESGIGMRASSLFSFNPPEIPTSSCLPPRSRYNPPGFRKGSRAANMTLAPEPFPSQSPMGPSNSLPESPSPPPQTVNRGLVCNSIYEAGASIFGPRNAYSKYGFEPELSPKPPSRIRMGPQVALNDGDHELSMPDRFTPPSRGSPNSQTILRGSDKEHTTPQEITDRPMSLSDMMTSVARAGRSEFVKRSGGKKYINEEASQKYLDETKQAIQRYHLSSSPSTAWDPDQAIESIENDSDAEMVRGDSTSPLYHRGGRLVNQTPVGNMNPAHAARDIGNDVLEQNGEPRRKRARLQLQPEMEETKNSVKKKKKQTRASCDSEEDIGANDKDDSDDSDFMPDESHNKKATNKNAMKRKVTKSASALKTPQKSRGRTSSNTQTRVACYTPRTTFSRGPRPQFSQKGEVYTDWELKCIKKEYEDYLGSHPDPFTRLHSTALGSFISDQLWGKYGINRSGNGIRMGYQRWVRGVLTNADDRLLANQDPKNLRTSLQYTKARKVAAASSTTATPSSDAEPSVMAFASVAPFSAGSGGGKGKAQLAVYGFNVERESSSPSVRPAFARPMSGSSKEDKPTTPSGQIGIGKMSGHAAHGYSGLSQRKVYADKGLFGSYKSPRRKIRDALVGGIE